MDVFISIVDFYTALNQLPSVENISFNMYGYLLCMNCTSSIFERKKKYLFCSVNFTMSKTCSCLYSLSSSVESNKR